MPDELPPLGKFVVSGFSEGNPSYPIVIVVKENRAGGYTAPALGDLCPDSRFAAHQFTGSTPTNIDNRMVWTYELIPGPAIITYPEDTESEMFLTVTRTKKLLSAITPGYSHSGADSATKTEKDPIDTFFGYETVTVYPKGPHYDEATALTSERVLPFPFPATLDIDLFQSSNGTIGTSAAFTKRVSHITKTFWVIADTAPSLSLNGIIDFGVALNVLGDDPLGNLVYNSTDDYDDGSDLYDLPGSIPDYDTYIADWVGGDPRSVLGSVTPHDGTRYRHRVDKVFVQFIMPRLPTLDVP